MELPLMFEPRVSLTRGGSADGNDKSVTEHLPERPGAGRNFCVGKVAEKGNVGRSHTFTGERELIESLG